MKARLFDYLLIAARHLISKKTRAFLTILGIAIGVAAVVATVSLGEGIRYQAITSIKSQSDLTLLEVGSDIRGDTMQLITEEKISRLTSLPHVKAVAPLILDNYATKRQTFLRVMGVRGDDFRAVINPAFSSGRMFSPGAHEVVIGATQAEALQRNEGIRIGDRIPVVLRQYDEKGRPNDTSMDFTLVGVIQSRGDQFDQVVLMDRDVAMGLRKETTPYDRVLVRIDDPDAVFPVADQVQATGLAAKGAFEQIRAVNQLMDLVVLFLALFAGISLIVGALMISNTMVTSVLERTREIGISMAIGASERDIMALVLYECLYIGIIGGVLGAVIGILFAGAINIFGPPLISARLGTAYSGLFGPEIARVTPEILIAGILIAVVLSLVAGIYPAYKASRLNPVDAIRSER
jgi:putative ABC transport system permease protein